MLKNSTVGPNGGQFIKDYILGLIASVDKKVFPVEVIWYGFNFNGDKWKVDYEPGGDKLCVFDREIFSTEYSETPFNLLAGISASTLYMILKDIVATELSIGIVSEETVDRMRFIAEWSERRIASRVIWERVCICIQALNFKPQDEERYWIRTCSANFEGVLPYMLIRDHFLGISIDNFLQFDTLRIVGEDDDRIFLEPYCDGKHVHGRIIVTRDNVDVEDTTTMSRPENYYLNDEAVLDLADVIEHAVEVYDVSDTHHRVSLSECPCCGSESFVQFGEHWWHLDEPSYHCNECNRDFSLREIEVEQLRHRIGALVSETSEQAPVMFEGVSTEKGSVIGVFRDPEAIVWFVVKVEERWIPVEFDEFPVKDILFVYKALRETE